MAEQDYSTTYFERLGADIMRRNTSSVSNTRRFRSFFGVHPRICATLWRSCVQSLPTSAQPKHLLLILHFLKTYNTFEILAGVLCVDEKTARKWVWIMVDVLADLKFVSLIVLRYFSLLTFQRFNGHYVNRAMDSLVATAL